VSGALVPDQSRRFNLSETGSKATKDTADCSEIVSFVALSRFKRSVKTAQIVTESVQCSALRMGHDLAVAHESRAVRGSAESKA
jgi:hypothetical protein